jgi:hypothetical protein
VGHVRLILLLACATALVTLSAPAGALAGTYSWSQPGDFTGSANPELKYGAGSWTYYDGLPGSPTKMSCSGTCTGTAGATIGSTGGELVLSAPALGAVTVGWSDPFGPGQPVTLTYSDTLVPPCGIGFVATDRNGKLLASGAQLTGPAQLTLLGGVSGCTAEVSVRLTAATHPVTLSTPASNSTFTAGEPVFSGAASTAFDAAGAVTVKVYPGPAAAGTPIETVSTTRSGGAYTAVPFSPLPNGRYTAQAVQQDPAGQANTSKPVTFTLENTAPRLTLRLLGSEPLRTSKPVFRGRAGSRPQDRRSVHIDVWAGTGVRGSPVGGAGGSVGARGRFSIRAPSLPDGRYTAVAGQLSAGLVGFSRPVTFEIKAHPPALRLTYPSPRELVSRSRVAFAGQAGDALGDSSRISVALYRGAKARGRALGRRTVHVTGASWSIAWGRKLPSGTYALRAIQTDDAGHTARVTRAFKVVPGPTTVGAFVSLSRSGTASLQVGCAARSGTCSGTVLVVTTRGFRTTPGGPFGPLRVLFAYVQVPAGTTQTVRGSVPGPVAATLRRAGGATVKVSTSLSRTGTTTAIRSLKLGS